MPFSFPYCTDCTSVRPLETDRTETTVSGLFWKTSFKMKQATNLHSMPTKWQLKHTFSGKANFAELWKKKRYWPTCCSGRSPITFFHSLGYIKSQCKDANRPEFACLYVTYCRVFMYVYWWLLTNLQLLVDFSVIFHRKGKYKRSQRSETKLSQDNGIIQYWEKCL